MSLIVSFEYRGDRNARFQAERHCGWFYADMPGGGRMLQLETYAQDGTTSQIMQFDRRAAGELLAIIAKVFVAPTNEPPEL
ncbi:hypothetical protein [Mycobacterium sp. Marseille-P9652]|uniref:hypothetical protein n=1 Tax=Mycobacterium sp. Marseille-P9652 TaxID=2654950 RepID=UPI0012E86CDF|nr:hypothetical protein [Mycobacterium sp. Marseille-P9652]